MLRCFKLIGWGKKFFKLILPHIILNQPLKLFNPTKMPRNIETHPCRKYKIEEVKKREIKEKVKVPIHKVKRNKQNKTKFLTTTQKNESIRKM